jgi:hypothetical protein
MTLIYVRDSGPWDKAETSAAKRLVRVNPCSVCYIVAMTKLLEEAVARVKALPDADQDIAAEFLLGFADPEAQQRHLSPEQIQEVELAKEEARQGKFAGPEQMNALWRRFGL